MTPTLYFGALVASVRVIWLNETRALCVCRCGATFLACRPDLTSAHRLGRVKMCSVCSAPARSAQGRRARAIRFGLEVIT